MKRSGTIRRRLGGVASTLLLTGLAIGSSTGCAPPPKDPAMTAYRRFVSAARMGDSTTVWRLMSPDAQGITKARLGLPKDATEPAVLERLRVRPGWGFEIDRTRWAQVDQSRSAADRKQVDAVFNGRRRLVPVIKINGGWRVDLFSSKQTPAG